MRSFKPSGPKSQAARKPQGTVRPQTDAEKAAKRREIDLHYKAKRESGWKGMSLPQRITSLRRHQLQRLLLGRGDRRSVEEAGGVDWHLQSPHNISDCFNVTLREKLEYGISNLPACDVTEEQEAWVLQKRRQEKNTALKRTKREATRHERKTRKMEVQMMVQDLSVREEAIHELLKASRKWTSVKQIARKVKGSRAFRRPDRKAIVGKSLDVTIRTALNGMIHSRQIEEKRVPGVRGFRLLVRWKNEGNEETRKLKRVITRKTPHGMGTTSPFDVREEDMSSYGSFLPREDTEPRGSKRAVRQEPVAKALPSTSASGEEMTRGEQIAACGRRTEWKR